MQIVDKPQWPYVSDWGALFRVAVALVEMRGTERKQGALRKLMTLGGLHVLIAGTGALPGKIEDLI